MLVFLASSCVWRHVTPTHNTPHFTDKNQFEGSYAVAVTGGNVNLAYSPIKYISLQLNGYSALIKSNSFNYQFEGAIGTFVPRKNHVIGVTLGCGNGATNWTRWWSASEGAVELKYAKFDTRKFYLNSYFSYKWKNESGFSGVSAKVNFLDEFYHLSSSDYGNFKKTNYSTKNISLELVGFVKSKISKTTFLTLNGGISLYKPTANNTSRPNGSDVNFILSVGLVHKF